MSVGGPSEFLIFELCGSSWRPLRKSLLPGARCVSRKMLDTPTEPFLQQEDV